MAVFSSDLMARLRWRDFSLVMLRFFWLLMFAIVKLLRSNVICRFRLALRIRRSCEGVGEMHR